MAADATRSLPTGTVTFLRTDVEDSMGLMRALGPGWDAVNGTHMGLVRRAIDTHGGTCVRTEGDAVFAVFPEARAAVAATIEAQRAITDHAWPSGVAPRVRMGLHSGEAYLSGDDYGGFEVNRAARLAATGHGGQIVLSGPTRALVEDALPDGVTIRDLGRHELRGVSRPESIHQLVVPGLRSDFPPLRTVGVTKGNLPDRLTSFIGRETDVARVAELLARHRLVTVTGPGGIGKTSLAIEAARLAGPAYVDGVWLVELDKLMDPAQVRPTIARTLGLFDGTERSAADGLLPYLADRSMLLVIDNFEHLLKASGEIGAILRAAPGSRVLATSRAPLRIDGEQELPLDPLPAETPDDASVRLFVERARSVRPSFDGSSDSAAIEEVCTLLDGLPLGIELAAARVALLPVGAIRDRLAARLPLPGAGRRDLPDRQRTLEGAIGWSYNLLDPARQRLLRDIAVFEGGFDLDQVAIVHDDEDVLEAMVDLIDQGLAARDPVAGDSIRFRLLKTIETFALGQLRAEGREDEVRRRHATAFLRLAEDAAPQMPGPRQRRLTERLRLDHANLRAALRWAIDSGDVELAQRLVGSLWRYWQIDGHLVEASTRATEVLGMSGGELATSGRLKAVTAAGGIAYWRGRTAEASAFYGEELELARQLGDRAAEADALYNGVYGRFIEHDNEGAMALLEQARAVYTELGDERGFARTEWTRGTIVMNGGRIDEAREIFSSALRRFQDGDDPWYESLAYGSLAWCGFFDGQTSNAVDVFVRSLLIDQALGDVSSMTIKHEVATVVALLLDRPDIGAELLGAMETAMETYGVRPPAGLAGQILPYKPRERVREALDSATYDAAFARGRRLSVDEAVELVSELARAAKSGPSTFIE